MNDGYLPIGRFARLCRLSVKQLRHYDEVGLLVPAHVDPDNGYRYYRPGQAREALLIGLLRSLDVPLVEVGRVPPGEAGVLGGVRDRMEADLARRTRTLAMLDQPKTLARMQEFMERSGLVMNGLHHEIYLSDVQETDPARMRTILRHPVRAT